MFMFGKKKSELAVQKSSKLQTVKAKAEQCKMAFTATAIATVTTLANQSQVLAGVDVSSKISDITSGDSDGGIFKDVVNFVVDIGKDLYTLIFVIGLVIGVICVGIASLSIMATKKSQNREENKNWFGYIFLGIGGVALAGSVVSLILSAASSANNNAGGSSAAAE